MALRDIRRAARRDLHGVMQIPAFYFLTPTSPALLVHVRIFDKWDQAGDIKGSRTYPAETENASPKLRFDLTEIAHISRGAVVSIEAGEAYKIDHTLPHDDQFQTAAATRMSIADAAAYTFPPAGTL